MRARFAAAALCSLVALLAAACGSSSSAPAPPADPPRLLVVMVVDQMRFDYITRYEGRWTKGLRRLLDQGAVFTEARYPYLNTVTCAGHATIGTGVLPLKSGIFLNEWWSRERGRRIICTDDGSAEPVSYASLPEPVGHGPGNLQVPTLGDRLRERTPESRVVTLSMKPRSAVMLAGHGATAVTWLGDNFHWATSTAYTEELLGEVKDYVDAHPMDHDRQAVWEPMAEMGSYAGADDGVGERPKTGWTARFPHPLAGAPGTPEDQFYTLWERSPYSDAYLGAFAANLVEHFQLGQRDVVDLLGVSFSGLDSVGHDFGPESVEAEDTLLRLDATIGTLLDELDRQVGRGRYALALSADHGVAPIPEAHDGGRVLPRALAGAVNDAMAELGDEPHVADVDYTNVYLTTRTREAVAGRPELLARAKQALLALPGVERVFEAREVDGQRTSTDPVLRAAALSYVPGRSGDLIVIPRRGWILSADATTHGSLYDYDQHVPLIVLGPGVTPGRYDTAASPADLAPTLASLAGLSLPDVDGTVLKVK
ncbi:MAG: alkaline phosphatase family protein [Vicinamibacterales bacterium]